MLPGSRPASSFDPNRQSPRRSIGFQDTFPAFPEQIMWKVDIYAQCPKCWNEATLGAMQGGGAILACSHCDYRSVNKDTNTDEVSRQILERAASGPKP